jgi:transposase InsO family protein
MTNKGELEIEMEDTLWVPKLNDNLVSVFWLVEKGHVVQFTKDGCFIGHGDERIRIAQREGNLYKLQQEEKCFVVTNEKDLEIERCVHDWHKRMAHRNLSDIRAMKKEGLRIKECDHSDDCEACIKGKMARKSFPKKATPTKDVFDCIVSDVCGQMQVESQGKKKYFVTFIDVHTKYTTVEFIREKSEVAQVTINFIESLKTQFGRKPKVFRTDRGTEYLNATLQDYLKKEGIRPQCTVGYAPEQNGIAERKNRTLMEGARTMLVESGLPKSFWAEAVNTANYVFNRIADKRTKKSPYEGMFKEKPKLTRFHEFGCDVYAMVPDEKRRKLDDKAEKMKFIGYSEESKGYRLIDKQFKVRISREVRFLTEKIVSKAKEAEMNEKEGSNEILIELSGDEGLEEFYDAEDESDDEDTVQENEQENVEVQNEIEEEPTPAMPPTPRRTQRGNAGKEPQRYGDFRTYKASDKDESAEPRSFQEAMRSKGSAAWEKAMREELKSIEENETWDLVELPAGRKAIGSKWVFKTKVDEAGKISRRKARLVAQGFSQKFGTDFDEIFAPVARSTTLRLLLSIAGDRNYGANQYDVKTAFLNGTLEEEIYMKQPPGFQNGYKVYKLKKSL